MSKRFPGVLAVDDVSFSAPAVEIIMPGPQAEPLTKADWERKWQLVVDAVQKTEQLKSSRFH
jgi:hypothetical protein